ncbi:DUF4091 domain-containing protein [Olivibacter sp. CPCC 100613]|uniref:DUF4091 domain-containing protein n=1 Tax=Olivibacter sp. CPCC 100613 TaxID=3079931 RepID=UPI002FF620D3
MKKIAIFFAILSVFYAKAQEINRSAIQELKDPYPAPASAWLTVGEGLNASFVSIDEGFKHTAPPEKGQLRSEWTEKAWRGEKVHTQALIWSKSPIEQVALTLTDLKDGQGNRIDPNKVKVGYVRYVLTDHLGELKSGCGIPKGLDTSLVADLIDTSTVLSLEKNTTRPIWLSIQIPQEAKPGTYRGQLIVKSAKATKTLPFAVEVLNHDLPSAKDWSYHLDLWQNPYSVARVYGVKPWSEAHFEAMKPYMEMLAQAGQKSITASIIYDPWNGQTYDIYQSMIKWTKKQNGQWEYDYRIFDKWVEFMMSFGIKKFINCYSMIPWNLKFYYFDEASGKEKVLEAKPGEIAYKNHWKYMLIDFAKHLKMKGWFDKTTIAMDERAMKDMLEALAIIKEADPNFKVSLAGADHPELYDQLVDYCVALKHELSPDVINKRRESGFTTTFYTCCTEPFPNTFTSSSYAESAWLAWYALNKDFDGYLRWAYNCWGPRPLQDTRYGTWSAGDAWLVYPGVRSSIRFERLVEGIQDYEKAKIIRAQLKKEGRTQELQALEAKIQAFETGSLSETPASTFVNEAKAVLNSF